MIRNVRPRSEIYCATQWSATDMRDAGHFAAQLAMSEIPFQIRPDKKVTIWQGQETFTVDDRSWVVILAAGKCKVMGNADFNKDYEVVHDE